METQTSPECENLLITTENWCSGAYPRIGQKDMEYTVDQVVKQCVISYAQGVLDINDERMKKPISVKLDRVPRFPGDWSCAVIVSRDVIGDIHLYVVANNHLYRKSLEKLFKVKMVGYVGHVKVDTDEDSAYYFPIVNSFSSDFLREKKVEMDKELKNRFPEWKEDLDI